MPESDVWSVLRTLFLQEMPRKRRRQVKAVELFLGDTSQTMRISLYLALISPDVVDWAQNTSQLTNQALLALISPYVVDWAQSTNYLTNFIVL